MLPVILLKTSVSYCVFPSYVVLTHLSDEEKKHVLKLQSSCQIQLFLFWSLSVDFELVPSTVQWRQMKELFNSAVSVV